MLRNAGLSHAQAAPGVAVLCCPQAGLKLWVHAAISIRLKARAGHCLHHCGGHSNRRLCDER